jgi:hypothetical protein
MGGKAPKENRQTIVFLPSMITSSKHRIGQIDYFIEVEYKPNQRTHETELTTNICSSKPQCFSTLKTASITHQ